MSEITTVELSHIMLDGVNVKKMIEHLYANDGRIKEVPPSSKLEVR